MGGMIAINVTHRLASFVRGGVFSAPALMIDPVLMKYRPIVSFLQSFMPKFVVSRLAPGAMCHDPVVIEQYCYDILNTPGVKKPVPARTALQLVAGHRGRDRVREGLRDALPADAGNRGLGVSAEGRGNVLWHGGCQRTRSTRSGRGRTTRS